MNDTDKAVEKLQQEDLIREYQGKPGADSISSAGINSEEPWLPIETKLVIWSVGGGIVALIVLAILVHIFLLGE